MERIFELDYYSVNERNGVYGGKAGDKEGITIDGQYWIVKYPKNTAGMRGDIDSYTTAPLSEHIGSRVYDILGVDVHKTILGIRNNKVVVACKDFCKTEGSLREVRTLKNVYNEQLSKIIESDFSSTSSSHLVDIDEIMVHFKYNPSLNKVEGVEERFWTQFVVDILINNNDRNNGNWGLLYEDGAFRIAPVFDNGAAFYNKTTDTKLQSIMQTPDRLRQSIETSRTVYSKNGKELFAKDLLSLEYPELDRVAVRLIPKILDKQKSINKMIMDIPSEYKGHDICSDVRKEFYMETMRLKTEMFLLPFYRKASSRVSGESLDGSVSKLGLSPCQRRGR